MPTLLSFPASLKRAFPARCHGITAGYAILFSTYLDQNSLIRYYLVSELSRDNLGWLLAKATQWWNERLEAAFREAGFPDVRPSFGSVLVPLFEEDDLRMGELGRRSGLSKQAMTTLVRSVEDAELVSRVPDPADGRAYRVSLTERGEALRPVAERVLRDLAARTRSTLSEQELESLLTSLRKVVES